jgi:tetratricopeptide (TPR) repeat protein
MIRRSLLLRILLLAVALSYRISTSAASEAVDSLLYQARDADLRARLLQHAATAHDSLERGEAFYYAGMSYEHAGLADSALACYQRAVELRGDDDELEAYAEALCLRGAGGDGARAVAAMRRRLVRARVSSEGEIATNEGRLGWAWYVAEQPDSALIYLRRNQPRLVDPLSPRYRTWLYRVGVVEFEHGDPSRAMDALVPLAVESRFQDRDVMGMLKKLGDSVRMTGSLQNMLRGRRMSLDTLDRAVINTLGGRRVSFSAADGFPLAGVVFPSRGPGRARAAVLVVPPDEPIEAFDSLAIGLRRAGYALMLLHTRGWGESVAPACPLPETWNGRERDLLDRCTTDVRFALRALAGAARVDTSRYLIIGVGPSAPIAAAAAAQDPRVPALLLVSPEPSPVERGMTRANLLAFRRPVFFEVSGEDGRTLPLVEALYEATDMRASRISESDRLGDRARVFRYDPRALPRITQWLTESWTGTPRRGAAR